MRRNAAGLALVELATSYRLPPGLYSRRARGLRVRQRTVSPSHRRSGTSMNAPPFRVNDLQIDPYFTIL